MPVELRKRKAPAEPVPPPPSKKKNPVKSAVEKAKNAFAGKKANGEAPAEAPTVGSVINLDAFGGEIETNDGEKTTLKKLVEASSSGVVLFTYPKASTPGCTKQACLFRDDYTPLTATGLSIYGLSRDSPKANTTFKEKQRLPYPLLCDTAATLIGAIGMKKTPSGTTRGVFAVDKSGKVLVAEAGGPDATVAAVKKIVVDEGTNSAEQGTDTKDPAPAAASVTVAPATSLDPEPASESTKMDIDPAPPVAEPEKSAPVALSIDAAPAAAPAPVQAEETAIAPAPAAAQIPVPVSVATTDPAPDTATAANGTLLTKEDSAKAQVAADVADTAAKIDPATPNPA